MRYWGWLTAKLAIAALFMYGLFRAIQSAFPRRDVIFYSQQDLFAHDLWYTTAMMVFWLIGAGILYVIVWDQRTRCRTCLRRLRMPIARGSWANMLLFGRPQTEYICVYGHGTLHVPQVELTGPERPDWEPHKDMWKELESLESNHTER